ncbi:MAG: restriction endonuclease subunit S [Candidatus Anammoxibacter sp.]
MFAQVFNANQSLLENSAKGITRKNLNSGIVQNLALPIPPINLQNKSASIVEQVKQTKQKIRASLDEMDNHCNALMQRYFG